MIDDLFKGTVVPEKVIVFIDNPEIEFDDNRVITIKSSKSFLPIIRFALGTIADTDYCFFIDDDLSVREKTLENFVKYAELYPDSVLGLEGSILGDTDTPYSNDTCINRGNVPEPRSVDVVIRTYFVPTIVLTYGLKLRLGYPDLPKESLDDVYLCLGNKYLNKRQNYVIPVDKETDLIELQDGGVGQSTSGEHYKNRNEVCRILMNRFL